MPDDVKYGGGGEGRGVQGSSHREWFWNENCVGMKITEGKLKDLILKMLVHFV